jgi:biotin transport system substrate-specific component
MVKEMNISNPALLEKIRSYSIQYQLALIVGFAVVTSIAAQFEIPTQPVPFTLQTFFVFLAGAVLGPRYGFMSMLLYLMMGVSGLPVFAGASAGFAKLIGPTGGYLLAFPIVAAGIGYLINLRKEFLWTVLSMFIGSVLLLGVGTIHLDLVYVHNWSESFKIGFLPFVVWDVLKVVAASAIYKKIAS